MIARNITTHDETGMRLLATTRDIHRTPTQSALNELATELASREGNVIYAKQRCLDGAAISKAYHFEGRVIVDSVYFSTIDELKRLYSRGPLGDGLFFANATKLTQAVALPSPASETLHSDMTFDDFTDCVNSLFPDEDSLADLICALRTQVLPLAVMTSLPGDEFSCKLYMAMELIMRSLPADAAAKLDFITLCGGEAPCVGLTGYASGENPDCTEYISLPDGSRSIDVLPSDGDYARADALLAGTLDDILDSSLADDAPKPIAQPTAQPATDNASLPKQKPIAKAAQPLNKDEAAPVPAQSDLDKAQQTLSASLRYANSHEFRRFTSGFMQLRTSMEPQLYFRYCLKYSDYLHRLEHPMCDIYDAELASLYKQPPAGLMAVQIALTMTGYPGALRGTIKHIEQAGVLDSFIRDTLPRMNAGDKPEDYAQSLLVTRSTLLSCMSEDNHGLVTDEIARAVNESLPRALRRVSAASLCSVRDALNALIGEEPTLANGAFDPAMSEIIDRIEFKRFDEHAEETYPALSFAYSYVRQWDGQVTDKQRAVCLWGRLMDGCSEWSGCVMEGVLRLLAPMSPVNRVDFMGFIRRYFNAMCDGGLTRSQISESVVIITMLTALRFDSQNNWSIDELRDVLNRLDEAGEGLEREFWQQINTRVDLLSMDMLNEAHEIAGQSDAHILKPARAGRDPHMRKRSGSYDNDYLDDDMNYAQPNYDDDPRANSRGRYGSGSTRYNRDDERDMRNASRARGREYDAVLSRRNAQSYSEREGGARQSSRQPSSRHSYSYDPDDPDAGRAGRGYYGDTITRYRIESRRKKRGSSTETLMLVALTVVAVGALAFCIVKYLM